MSIQDKVWEVLAVKIAVLDDAPILSLEDSLNEINWEETTDYITDSLIDSPVPLGWLADAVLQAPFDLVLPSQLFGPRPMAMGVAGLRRPPHTRSRFMKWLTGWRQEESYDPTAASVLWYECHVPHGGSAHTQTVQARSRSLPSA